MIAPGINIRFDPKLVSELKADHVQLISLFNEISTITAQRDNQLLNRQLGKFGSTLQGHILKENVRFYVYLKSSLQEDEDNLFIMQGFSQEMQQIGRSVTDFLHKYTNIAQWDGAQWTVFDRDLKEIGAVLRKRFESEEKTLYPLYLSPDN